ncbi:MAG: hypothetical protein JSR33_01700 [Proteobacteria bacterium]|nr:hypothetical protein [Pseudomonadota bacterium]
MREILEKAIVSNYPKNTYLKYDLENSSLGIKIFDQFFDSKKIFDNWFINAESYDKFVLKYFPNLAYHTGKKKFQRLNYLSILKQIQTQQWPTVPLDEKQLSVRNYSMHLVHEFNHQQYLNVYELIQLDADSKVDIYLSLPPKRVKNIFLCRYQLPLGSYQIILLNSKEGILFLIGSLEAILEPSPQKPTKGLPLLSALSSLELQYLATIKNRLLQELRDHDLKTNAGINYLCREAAAFVCRPLPENSHISYAAYFFKALDQITLLKQSVKDNIEPVKSLNDLSNYLTDQLFSLLEKNADYKKLTQLQKLLNFLANPPQNFDAFFEHICKMEFQSPLRIHINSAQFSVAEIIHFCYRLYNPNSSHDWLVKLQYMTKNIIPSSLPDQVNQLKADLVDYEVVREHNRPCCINEFFGFSKAIKIGVARKLSRNLGDQPWETFTFKEIAALREYHHLRNRPSKLGAIYHKHQTLIENLLKFDAAVKMEKNRAEIHKIMSF